MTDFSRSPTPIAPEREILELGGAARDFLLSRALGFINLPNKRGSKSQYTRKVAEEFVTQFDLGVKLRSDGSTFDPLCEGGTTNGALRAVWIYPPCTLSFF